MSDKKTDKELSIDELRTVSGAGYSPEDEELEYAKFVGTESCNDILGQSKGYGKVQKKENNFNPNKSAKY